ncbi:alpha/beta fold hydrolase [Myceligenerans salitolerans]|uniref:Alpha/beta hydrolase n=1 Tax=Myceligenerans salitolerans TaxID=1230528 RepID=A0ABS3IAN8_9MICO|nr:alpha/beta hydrolase [Myceligenerans salitolerans]MBO0610068.1 alpha/beta hydrolase [Myceligenerans salitolerans]
MNLKRTLLAAGVALTALVTTAGAPVAAQGPHTGPEKPTVVLVHGAFADSSSWNGVITDLRRAGYPVIAPANPLRGLHGDAEYLSSVLDSIEGPVILAGHSYGGSVITQAAAGDRDVKALVYIASFQLDAGESTAELAAKYPGGELGPALDAVPFPAADGTTGTDLYVQQDEFRRVFAADVPRRTTTLLAATQRPIAESALNDTATRAAWKTIPSWALITTEDLTIPADSMRFMSERAGSHTTEIKASHAVAVSRPHVVSDLIERAARTTVR